MNIITNEKNRLQGVFRLEVFDSNRLLDIIEFRNIIVNAGGALAADLIIGAGGTAFNNANAYIGVGNGTTAVNVAHTDLQGASKTRKAMDATFPSRSGQVVTWKSTFGTSDANYSWEEMAVFNASSGGVMLCRALVASPFTKTSSLSIVATYTLTIP